MSPRLKRVLSSVTRRSRSRAVASGDRNRDSQALGAIAHRPSIDLENVAVKLPRAVRVEHEQQVSDQRAADHGPGARGLPRWRSPTTAGTSCT